jgi:hypothetical protein
LSNKLADDLQSENCKGKTISLKLKKSTFEISLRSLTLSYYTSDSSVILETAKLLLDNELSVTKPEDAIYRLIGVKVSNFLDNQESKTMKGQLTLSGIFRALETDYNNSNTNNDNNLTENIESLAEFSNINNEVETYECSVCLKTFSHKYLLECHENDCIDKAFNISAMDDSSSIETLKTNNSSLLQNSNDNNSIVSLEDEKNDKANNSNVKCPICSMHIIGKNNEDLNSHIDICLNKSMCLELTQVPVKSYSPPSSCLNNKNTTLINKNKKRTHSQTKLINTKHVKDNLNSSQKSIEFFFRYPK